MYRIRYQSRMYCAMKARKCFFPVKIFSHFRLILCFISTILIIVIIRSHYRSSRSHYRSPRLGPVLPLSEPEVKCVHPKLDPFHPSLVKHFFTIPKLECSQTEDNWVYVINGTFYISDKISKLYGALTCDINPLIRVDDFKTEEGQSIRDVQNGTKLTTDFFKVSCNSIYGKQSYTNVHAGISLKKTAEENQGTLSFKSLGLNILMVGFDSISRMTAIRKLPITRKYFLNVLKGFDLEGYNILGDGTPAAILPILTGQTEEELPEARRGHENAKPVDGHPWIWNDYAKSGYVTAYSEDQPQIGAFHYRMLGFKDQPTDHYMRNFYLAADDTSKDYCYGSVPKHKYFLDWLRDVFVAYPNKRKFVFGFHCELSHEDSNKIDYFDNDVANFFKHLETQGFLNNTLLVFMSDHGARFSSTREASQGKQEERMPMLSLRFPPWFQNKYPDAYRALMINSQRLTTPHDIHATFHDVLNFSGAGRGNISNRAISLFDEIPKERTCAHAGVELHWCACLAWQPVEQSNPTINRVLQIFIARLNGITSPHRGNCETLRVKSVIGALQMSTNSNVLTFKKAADKDGRVGDFSDDTQDSEIYYQIIVATVPGNGHFEFTVRHVVESDEIHFTEKDISRINKYGSDPDCIAKDFPHLRQFCYCKLKFNSKFAN